MNQIIINGKSISVKSGKSISIINGKVIVDGEEYKAESDDKVVNITIQANVERLEVGSADKVIVEQNCGRLSCISGNVEIQGDVWGDVKSTSGNISCGDVSGDVKTVSGNINRR